MIKTNRLIFMLIISVLLTTAAGCSNNANSLQNGKQQTASSSSESKSSETGQQSSSPSSFDIVSTVPSVKSESQVSSAGTVPQTQQEVLNKVRKALNTNVTLALPKNVSLKSGKYLTAVASSSKSKYSVKLYQSSKPAAVNSKDASKGTLIAAITGAEMKNAEIAKESISGYIQGDTSDYGDDGVDLGHNIKGFWDCGCGHQSIIWNEGRWCIRVDGPTDKTYASKNYPDSKALAISVVAYLNKYMLPAPHTIGIINMSTWQNESSDRATVEWQNGKMVYQIDSSNPMAALETAAAMNHN